MTKPNQVLAYGAILSLAWGELFARGVGDLPRVAIDEKAIRRIDRRILKELRRDSNGDGKTGGAARLRWRR